MIDVHVHLSAQINKDGYFTSIEDSLKELRLQTSPPSPLTHFCCFPHRSEGSYNTSDLNLSLIGLPRFIVPFFRFKLARRLASDISSYHRASPKALVKYTLAKVRMQTHGDDLEQTVSLARQHAVRGLKFHDLQDGTLSLEVFRRLISLDHVVIYHGFPQKLRSYLSAIPSRELSSARCIFVFAHFGYSMHAPAHETSDIGWIATNAPPWLLFDCSFVPLLPLQRPVLPITMPRLLFGSDFPAMEPLAQLSNLFATARLCGVPEDRLRRTMENNSRDVASLLGLGT